MTLIVSPLIKYSFIIYINFFFSLLGNSMYRHHHPYRIPLKHGASPFFPEPQNMELTWVLFYEPLVPLTLIEFDNMVSANNTY